jgi:hypothetical protein
MQSYLFIIFIVSLTLLFHTELIVTKYRSDEIYRK